MQPNQGIQFLMLGSFGLYNNGQPVSLKMKQTSKPVQLLQLLLYHREDGVSRQTVVENLFGNSMELDITNTLNATVSQLRRLLRESSLSEKVSVRLRFDRYFFDTSETVWSDIEVVSKLRQQADLMSGPDKLSVLYQLCSLYQGRFLPALDGTEWVEVVRAHYQRIFQQSMREIFTVLNERRDFAEMERLSKLVSSLFPFEDWQFWQQESLLEQGRLAEAKILYQNVTKLYQRELDTIPPESMRLQLTTQRKNTRRDPESIHTVMQWLSELTYDGPILVPFPAFQDIYNLALRQRHSPLGILLCTLSDSEKHLFESMNQLEQILFQSLGPKDLFTQYTRSQYLVVRTDSNLEDDTRLIQTVTTAFPNLSKLTVSYQQITD